MDNPKCKICGDQTHWYGWIHGWLCAECDLDIVEVVEDEDASHSRQPQEDSRD